MTVLSAAVAVVGTVSLLNLILVYGVIRRLRTQTASGTEADGSPVPGSHLRTTVEPFTATSVDGGHVSETSLAAGTPVGFFAAGCAPCRDLLPRFVAAVRNLGGDVLAVVADGDGHEEYVAALSPVATVVAGVDAQTLAEAFGVQGYPTLCRVGAGGAVEELSRDLRELRDVVRA